MDTDQPFYRRLFKPDSCSDEERWLRIFASAAIWFVGFMGIWWYIGHHEGSCGSSAGDRCLAWHNRPGLGLHLLGALIWLASSAAVLLNTHRSELVDTRGPDAAKPVALMGLGFIWLIGLWAVLGLFGVPRYFCTLAGFAMLGLVAAALAFRGDENDPEFIRGARCETLADYRRRLVKHLQRTAADPDVIRAIETGDQSRSVIVAGAPLPPATRACIPWSAPRPGLANP